MLLFSIIPLTVELGRTLVELNILSIYKIKRSKQIKKYSNYHFNPKISVVIPAHNEEEYIEGMIESILSCSYLNKEILVVDDGSTDNTQKIVKKYVEKNLVYLFHHDIPMGSKPTALNPFFDYATGDILVIVDADSVMDKNALNKIPKYFEDKDVVAVSGHVKIGSGDKNINNILVELQKYEYHQANELGRKLASIFNIMNGMTGAFLIIRRDAFEKIGRFNEDIKAEDLDITLKLRKLAGKILFAEDAVVYTFCPNNLKSFVKQRLYWAEGEVVSILKHRNIIRDPDYLSRTKIAFMDFSFTEIVLSYAAMLYMPILAWLFFSEMKIEFLGLLAIYLILQSVNFFYVTNSSDSRNFKSFFYMIPLLLFFYGPLTRILRVIGFTKIISSLLYKKISRHFSSIFSSNSNLVKI